MNTLPPELLTLILEKNVDMCRCDKNGVLNLRLVCQAFNKILRPSIFKTIQLEFTRFIQFRDIDGYPDRLETLQNITSLPSSINLDMTVVRDPDEIDRLKDAFDSIVTRVPEMADMIESLRNYCLHVDTFTEEDYGRLIRRVFHSGPQITRLKLSLPFQVVGSASMTTTRLLAHTLACAANRPEEHLKIDTMVLDHVSDKTINNIFNVPIDVENAFKTFENLKSLVISFKRQEDEVGMQAIFARNIWLLIRKAQDLESLCLIGSNVARKKSRRNSNRVDFMEWSMQFPFYYPSTGPVLNNLRFLELKRLDIDPDLLFILIKENCRSLTELYLIEVSLKVFGSVDKGNISLWVGHPNVNPPKREKGIWLAPALREIEGLNLRILRVSGLSYDDYDPDPDSVNPNYDLDDPTGHNQSLEQRFVEAVLGTKAPPTLDTLLSDTSFDIRDINGKALDVRNDPDTYDANTYQVNHNTTSIYKRSIDGVFYNHTEGALRELQKIIDVADRGMLLISRDIERSQGLTVDHGSGSIIDPSAGI
ncbi:70453b71-9b86-444e-a33c-34edcf92859c [Sclerotinia trifoliorum]|uniref:70453b71-9b86-444e-a33c-34edcf92859c n=1 Tax=Sclerotinia trifoliorum TaxID=28548 RepID=A0A8H2VZ99_9HELO|nr:70453b71-9b86-444e-a33c-34edcf92859c [Sclerotinia trifoliorum]